MNGIQSVIGGNVTTTAGGGGEAENGDSVLILSAACGAGHSDSDSGKRTCIATPSRITSGEAGCADGTCSGASYSPTRGAFILTQPCPAFFRASSMIFSPRIASAGVTGGGVPSVIAAAVPA